MATRQLDLLRWVQFEEIAADAPNSPAGPGTVRRDCLLIRLYGKRWLECADQMMQALASVAVHGRLRCPLVCLVHSNEIWRPRYPHTKQVTF